MGQTRTSSLGAARPLPPSADIGPGGQSVGQAAQFCFSATLAMPPDTGNMISFIRTLGNEVDAGSAAERAQVSDCARCTSCSVTEWVGVPSPPMLSHPVRSISSRYLEKSVTPKIPYCTGHCTKIKTQPLKNAFLTLAPKHKSLARNRKTWMRVLR